MPLHKVPDSRTGKGVFIQYVPHSGPPIRGRPGPESDREAGQNLVSEPAHEDEENEQRKGRQQRTITWTASRKQTPFTTRHMESTDVPEHTAKSPLLPFIFITLLDFCIHPNLERLFSDECCFSVHNRVNRVETNGNDDILLSLRNNVVCFV